MKEKLYSKRKRAVVEIVIGLLILITLILGVTYAYFTANITGNENTETITMESGKLTINYSDGKNINVNNIIPSDKVIDSKVFTLTGSNNTDLAMPYFIELHVIENTFFENALTYTMISQNTTDSGKVAPSISSQKGIPTGSGIYQLGSANFVMGQNQIHTYTLNIYFPNNPTVSQNENQNKIIRAYIGISAEALSAPLLADLIKDANPLKINADLNVLADNSNIATQSGLFATEDDYGTSYYFRGVVDNNLLFAGYQWKIIRIDGNGNIKLIYNGTEEQYIANGTVNTIANTTIGISEFNSDYYDPKHVGYVYDGTTDSTVKQVVDQFFNGLSDKAKSKITTNIYCNDITIVAGEYGAYDRLKTKKEPSLVCPESSGKLLLQSGLITADEVALAGGKSGSANSFYYLYNGGYYWTMSPHSYLSNYFGDEAFEWYVDNTGTLYDAGIYEPGDVWLDGVGGNWPGYINREVRPVITILNSDVNVTGSGTATNPYKVNLD